MKFPQSLCVLLAVSMMAVMSACGGGSGNGSPGQRIPPPPPTGTNYTTCSGQQVPNWQSSLFKTPYQAAIAALVQTYGSNSNIGYIRVGLGRGGEINLPQGWNQQQSSNDVCYGGYSGTWGYTVGGSSPSSSTWNTYLDSMVTYEGSLHSGVPLLVSITPINGANPSTITDDFIAGVAHPLGISFGNQGLESSDIANFPNCGGDWCDLFAQYHPQIAELQTLGQSCPDNTTCANNLAQSTGPLTPLLPFAIAHGANDLELYYQDWLIAYDADYASSVGASSSSAAYAQAIQAAASAGATMQVLFPPQQGDNTMCGSQTCYAAVQALLTDPSSSPYITGVVIDVDWSDIEPTQGHFDFTTITNPAIQQWLIGNKQVNLVFQNTTYGGNNCPNSGIGSNGNVGSNCAMPPWVWTALQ
jgi:hypothetical protein